MRNRHRRYTTKRGAKNEQAFAVKTVVQSITALLIFLVIWGISVSEHPRVQMVCDKIKHYLTYTVDVRSVFQPVTENNEGD